jgi:hypothetical protein
VDGSECRCDFTDARRDDVGGGVETDGRPTTDPEELLESPATVAALGGDKAFVVAADSEVPVKGAPGVADGWPKTVEPEGVGLEADAAFSAARCIVSLTMLAKNSSEASASRRGSY